MLPKIELPKYTTTLPISGSIVKYRPYIVKEENILKYAAQSGEESDYEDAIRQIIENCASVSIDDIHPADFEWLFLKIHAASNNNIVEVIYNVEDCDNEKCPKSIPGYFDINKIELNKDNVLNSPYKQRGNSYIIPITENIGMQLKKVVMVYDDDYKTLYTSLVSIYEDDKIYPKSSITFEEFIEFVDEIPKPIANQIKEFFYYEGDNIKCNVIGDCTRCGRRFTQTVDGLKSFFA